MESRRRVLWVIAAVAVLFSLALGFVAGLLIGGVAGYVVGRTRAAGATDSWPEMVQRTPTAQPWWPGWSLPAGQPWRQLPETQPVQTAGALVAEVLSDTPAERAGLRPGDIILAVDDVAVDPDHPLPDVIAQYQPGDRVSLAVLREGEEISIRVDLAEHPDEPGRAYLGVRVRSFVQTAPASP